MQQQFREAEDKWSAQLMQARQTALDESFQRSTQQQAVMERTAENAGRLQQQVDVLTAALSMKDAELQAAHKQLAAAMDATQELEATHSKVRLAPAASAGQACTVASVRQSMPSLHIPQ